MRGSAIEREDSFVVVLTKYSAASEGVQRVLVLALLTE